MPCCSPPPGPELDTVADLELAYSRFAARTLPLAARIAIADLAEPPLHVGLAGVMES